MTTTTRRPPDAGLRVLAALLALPSVLALSVSPAAAHDDEGQMTVTTASSSDENTVQLEIGLVYISDGHLAEEATVTATLTGPEGDVIGPIDLSRTSGSLYGADIEVSGPGSWDATVTATNPSATADATVEVSRTPDSLPPATSEPDATTTPDPATSEQVTGEVSAAPGDEDDDNGAAIVIAVIAVLVLIAAATGFVIYRRRADADTAGDLND